MREKTLGNVEQCFRALERGEVIAYPTEAVFGLGCDPDNIEAIKNLLALKKRDKAKGLILIATESIQLNGYINIDSLCVETKFDVLASWPGPITWVIPPGDKITDWVMGKFNSVAVRVTDHPDVQVLCKLFGKPITSTSANLSGEKPCLTVEEVVRQFGDRVSCVFDGKIGGRNKPTEIRDACSGNVLRQG
nr:Sua5/YciO/YrdC/YwlC family protein [Candidatus Enterovibrio escacola]